MTGFLILVPKVDTMPIPQQVSRRSASVITNLVLCCFFVLHSSIDGYLSWSKIRWGTFSCVENTIYCGYENSNLDLGAEMQPWVVQYNWFDHLLLSSNLQEVGFCLLQITQFDICWAFVSSFQTNQCHTLASTIKCCICKRKHSYK